MGKMVTALFLCLGILLGQIPGVAFGLEGPPPPNSFICHPRAEILALLEDRYGEKPTAFGITNAGALVELLESRQQVSGASTWTIVLSSPDGLSCMIAAGEGWRRKLPGDPL